MSKRNDIELLQDIIESIRRIGSYAKGMDYAAFRMDTKTQDAVIRNIEIMGEATKLLSDSLRAEYSDIPWKSIAGARDRLIHNYFGVNIDIVWNIVIDEIPRLLTKITEIHQRLNAEHG